jgi:hypothetical protein
METTFIRSTKGKTNRHRIRTESSTEYRLKICLQKRKYYNGLAMQKEWMQGYQEQQCN